MSPLHFLAAFLLTVAFLPGRGQTSGVVDRWLALGAFPMVEADTRLTHDYLASEGGELTIAPDVGSPGQGLTWSPVIPDSAGFLRFARLLMSGRRGNSFSYAHTYLRVRDGGVYRLRVESANDVVAFLNGQRLFLREADRPQRLRIDSIEVRLAAGWNRLLIKLGNRTGPYLLRASLRDARGRPATGFQASAARPADLPAVFPATVTEPALTATDHWVIDSVGRLWQPVFATALPRLAAESQLRLGARTLTPQYRDARGLVYWVPVLPLLEHAAREGRVELRAGALTLRWSPADLLARLARPILVAGPPKPPYDRNPLLAGFELRAEPEAAPERIRILNPGYPDIRESLRWAAHFSGDSASNRWTEEDDLELVRQLLGRDKSAYFEKLGEVDRRLTTLTERLKADTLWLVGHAHIDGAWLWPRDETVSVTRNTLRSALAVGALYPEFRFMQNSPAYLEWIERSDPDLFAQIRQAVASDRWALAGGGWVEADLNMSSGESLVRHQLLSQRYFESRFGRRANLAWLLDVFGHAYSFPQILLESGYDRFVIHKVRWNDRNRFPYTAFRWEGLDGSRIPTYVAYLYDHNMNGVWLARDYAEHKASTGAADQMILFGVSDHGGGPTREMMEAARALQRIGPFPALAHSLPGATLDKVFAARDSLQLWRGELYVEAHRGSYTSQARIKRWNRRLESRIESAEKLAALAWTRGLEYPAAALDSAWRLLLFNQFHDILAGSSIDSVYQDARRDFAVAEGLLAPIVESGLATLAEALDTRGPGEPLVVFNPLSWTRTGPVTLGRASEPGDGRPSSTEGQLALGDIEIVDAAGRRLPSFVRADSITFLADSVPPLGLKVFWLRASSDMRSASDPPQSGGISRRRPATATVVRSPTDYTLENERLRVRVSPETGNLVSLVDKRSGRELVPSGTEANHLVVLQDSVPFWEAWNLGWTGASWPVDSILQVARVSDGNLRGGVRVRRAWGASTFEQTYWLYPGGAILWVESEVDWQEDRKMLKAAFPLTTLRDTVWAEIPYGAFGRPAVPRTALDSAKYEAPMQRWLDVSDGVTGVAVLNDSHYGYDVEDGAVRISLLRAPRWPDPNSDRGRHRFIYALYPHDGDWRNGRAWRAGWELNLPLLARREPAHAGELGTAASWLGVSEPSAVITALKRSEDGTALLLRLVELSGHDATTFVTWRGPANAAWSANLLEDRIEELSIRSGSLELPLRPFQIRSVLLALPRGAP